MQCLDEALKELYIVTKKISGVENKIDFVCSLEVYFGFMFYFWWCHSVVFWLVAFVV